MDLSTPWQALRPADIVDATIILLENDQNRSKFRINYSTENTHYPAVIDTSSTLSSDSCTVAFIKIYIKRFKPVDLFEDIYKDCAEEISADRECDDYTIKDFLLCFWDMVADAYYASQDTDDKPLCWVDRFCTPIKK